MGFGPGLVLSLCLLIPVDIEVVVVVVVDLKQAADSSPWLANANLKTIFFDLLMFFATDVINTSR